MKHSIQLVFLVLLSTVLSSCRYVHWANEIFNQGCPVPTVVPCAQKYVRSLHMYDQLTTLGLFDALWLSDNVITYYEDLYSQVHCCNEREPDCSCDSNYEGRCISFYVLGWIKGSIGTRLTDDDSAWSLSLRLDGVCYPPLSLKMVELPPEYRAFFGKTFTRFKTAYLVTFDAHKAVIDAQTRKVELVFQRVGVQGSMVWCLDDQGCIIPERDFDKNVLAYDI